MRIEFSDGLGERTDVAWFVYDTGECDADRTLTLPDGTSSTLTKMQANIFRYLFNRRSRWVRADEPIRDLWPGACVTSDADVFEAYRRTLATHVSAIRKHLGREAGRRILSGDGDQGYRFTGVTKSEDHIPPFEEMVRSPYAVCAATREDIIWAAGLATRVYQGNDVIPPETMLAWYDANPNGWSILKNRGQNVGNLDILPLRPAALEAFIAGRSIELDFTGADIYTPAETELIDALYVESCIGTINPDAIPPRIDAFGVGIMLFQYFQSMVHRVCRPRKTTKVYAIAASPAGAALLLNLGFTILCSRAKRRDEHDLFCASLPVVLRRLATSGNDRVVIDEAIRELIDSEDDGPTGGL